MLNEWQNGLWNASLSPVQFAKITLCREEVRPPIFTLFLDWRISHSFIIVIVHSIKNSDSNFAAAAAFSQLEPPFIDFKNVNKQAPRAQNEWKIVVGRVISCVKCESWKCLVGMKIVCVHHLWLWQFKANLSVFQDFAQWNDGRKWIKLKNETN